MKFSLLISTRGRVEEVARLFRSLEEQSLQDFEILLSDQNEDNRLVSVLADTPWKDRLVRLRNTGGLSLGRNRGLELARGEIIGFPDDDCCYPPQLLEQVYDWFAAHPEWGFLSGRSYTDGGGDAVSRHARHASPIRKIGIYSQCIEFAFFIRRSNLGSLRFDEKMGVGSLSPWQSDEGPDLMLRLQENGVRGFYDPQIGVWHPKPVQDYDARTIDRSYRYACGTGYFLRKHRYPLWYVGYLNARTLCGLGLSLVTLKWGKASFFLSRLRGRWRGWTGYAREQEGR